MVSNYAVGDTIRHDVKTDDNKTWFTYTGVIQSIINNEYYIKIKEYGINGRKQPKKMSPKYITIPVS